MSTFLLVTVVIFFSSRWWQCSCQFSQQLVQLDYVLHHSMFPMVSVIQLCIWVESYSSSGAIISSPSGPTLAPFTSPTLTGLCNFVNINGDKIPNLTVFIDASSDIIPIRYEIGDNIIRLYPAGQASIKISILNVASIIFNFSTLNSACSAVTLLSTVDVTSNSFHFPVTQNDQSASSNSTCNTLVICSASSPTIVTGALNFVLGGTNNECYSAAASTAVNPLNFTSKSIVVSVI